MNKNISDITLNINAKMSAQVLIRWAVQRGTIVIPKSLNPKNIKANLEIFDFELSSGEMVSIKSLDKNYRFVDPWEWWKIPYFN
jgi:alcohol dehydrogenase (NADP+)